MSVYVDTAKLRYRYMIMSHMLADTLEELHAMADKIGIDRKHFQSDASTPHYDICQTKRAKAIECGAIIVSRQRLVEIMRKLRHEAVRSN
jgi:Protein of unknown function (DUF4031)